MSPFFVSVSFSFFHFLGFPVWCLACIAHFHILTRDHSEELSVSSEGDSETLQRIKREIQMKRYDPTYLNEKMRLTFEKGGPGSANNPTRVCSLARPPYPLVAPKRHPL